MMAFGYFIFFQALDVRDVFFAQLFFPVLQTTLQDCEKQHLPVFDVVLGVRVGFVPFMEIGCITPLVVAR
jgi:hypothetical protein